jgi:hypothetical protein
VRCQSFVATAVGPVIRQAWGQRCALPHRGQDVRGRSWCLTERWTRDGARYPSWSAA